MPAIIILIIIIVVLGKLGVTADAIEAVRRDAQDVLKAASRFGVGMDDDQDGYVAGRAFFPDIADRMHLTAAIAKCADFSARAEAFVKNAIAFLQGREPPYQDHQRLWPFNAQQAVERNERNLGLRATEVIPVVERAKPQTRSRSRDLDDGLDL